MSLATTRLAAMSLAAPGGKAPGQSAPSGTPAARRLTARRARRQAAARRTGRPGRGQARPRCRGSSHTRDQAPSARSMCLPPLSPRSPTLPPRPPRRPGRPIRRQGRLPPQPVRLQPRPVRAPRQAFRLPPRLVPTSCRAASPRRRAVRLRCRAVRPRYLAPAQSRRPLPPPSPRPGRWCNPRAKTAGRCGRTVRSPSPRSRDGGARASLRALPHLFRRRACRPGQRTARQRLELAWPATMLSRERPQAAPGWVTLLHGQPAAARARNRRNGFRTSRPLAGTSRP